MIPIQKDDAISVLPLNVRAINKLKHNGYKTVQAFLNCPESEILKIKGVGVGTAQVIAACRSQIKQQDGQLYLDGTPPKVPPEPSCGDVEILVDASGKAVSDFPLSVLPLGNGARNCLERGGIRTVSQLMGKTPEQLARLRNMGPKGLAQVRESLKKVRTVTAAAESISTLYTFDSLADDLACFYQGSREIWLREVLRVHNEYPRTRGESFLYALYAQPKTREAAKQKILYILDTSRQPLHDSKLLARMPRHLENSTVLNEILIELEAEHRIFREEDGEGGCWLRQRGPALIECLPLMTKEDFPSGREKDSARQQEVLSMRLAGMTLEEVGKKIGVTREWVRQIEYSAIQNIRKVRPYLAEDAYLPFYAEYNLEKDAFQEIFQLSDETMYSLQILCQKTAAVRKSALEMLEDDRLDANMRRKADAVLHQGFVMLDGHWIRRTRIHMAMYYVEHFCKDAVNYPTFIQKYNAFVEELPLKESEKQKIYGWPDDKGLMNQLRNSLQVLWTQGKRFRYYNLEAYDFRELEEAIALDSYNDVEISTLKFFRDEPELMRRYDIRSEYELHNLLKKLWSDRGDRVKFSRMPTIRIGNGSYAKQVVQMLEQEGPMTTDAACTRFEELYGVKKETCLGCYLKQPERIFCVDGMHQVECLPLPEAQDTVMKQLLNLDFYTIQQVQKLYHQQFPETKDSELSPCHMKQLGFIVYTGCSGYMVRDSYGSAREYFRQLLKQDVLDLNREHPILNSVSAFNCLKHEMSHSLDVVEFAPRQFISMQKLEKAGVTKDDLRAYSEQAASVVLPGSYFTAKSLRESGFACEKLESLGFEDWFFGSLLLENTRQFSCQRIGNTRIFLRGEKDAALGDMLTRLIEQMPGQYMEIHDLNELLEKRYGITLPLSKLIQIIGETTMFYEPTTMKTVYLDYDVYYEEI